MVIISNPADFPAALAIARRLEAQQTMTTNSAASNSVAALLQVLPALTPITSANLVMPECGCSDNRCEPRSRDSSQEPSTERLSREMDQLMCDFNCLGLTIRASDPIRTIIISGPIYLPLMAAPTVCTAGRITTLEPPVEY